MNPAGNKKTIFAPKLAITEGFETLPERLLILPWGESVYDGGAAKLVVNDTSVSLIPEMQRRSNFDKLALDFNHNSIPGTESYAGEPVKVAAYGVLEIVPNDGIYLANLEWTADGEKAWRGKYYKDISPAVLPDDSGVVTFVHSAALCRNGRIPGLEAFSADFLNNKPKVNMDKYKQMVCRLLAIPEDTEDAAIETAFKKAVEQAGKEANPQKGKIDELEKKLETFSTTLSKLETSLNGVVKNMEDSARESVLSAALAEGKIVPEDAKNLELSALKTFCANLPSVVPVARSTPEGVKEFSAQTPTNPLEAEVCKNLGLSAEDFKKGEQ